MVKPHRNPLSTPNQPTRVPRKQQKPIDKTRWLHGECYGFAEALAILTGWKPFLVMGFVDPTEDEEVFCEEVHGVVKHPGGYYVDASGRVSKKKLCERYEVEYVEMERVSLVRMRNQGGHQDAVVADAMADIQLYARSGDPFFSTIPGLSK